MDPPQRRPRRDNYYLPQELIADILPRLPTAAAAVRFRCVCKSWSRLLSDGKFIYRHLFSGDGEAPPIVMITQNLRREVFSSSLYYSLLSHHTLLPKTTPYDNREGLPYELVPNRCLNTVFSDCRVEIVGCCNGLFCTAESIRGWVTQLILWNPSTLEIKHLPWINDSEQIGFGFDSRTGDYKVVAISNSTSSPCAIQIYSLKNDLWSAILVNAEEQNIGQQNRRFNEFATMHNNKLSSYGKIYWYNAYLINNYITCFDIREERFSHQSFPNALTERVVHVPPESECRELLHLATTPKEDSLMAVFQFDNNKDNFEIWGLLRFHSAESWVKLFHCDGSRRILGSIGIANVIGVAGNGKYVLIKENGELFRFNFEKEEITCYNRIRVVRDRDRTINYRFKAYCYVPSQVSLY